jgi:hypothetical protein
MGTSDSIKNGQLNILNAGAGVLATRNLVSIGGPGNEAWAVGTIDYAAVGTASNILAQTSINASATPGAARMPVVRDALGNIYTLGTNSSGNAVVYKTSPKGVLLGSLVLDGAATSVNTPKLLPLSNGTFAAVYARAAGVLYFATFDAALDIITGPTTVGTEYHSTNLVYHDAVALSGGGFAIAFQSSAGTAVNLVTVNNAGTVTLAATSIQTLASTAAQEYLLIRQLASGNLQVAMRGAMTSGGNAGTSLVIVTTGGAAAFGPTNVDNTATLGFLEMTVLAGGTSAIAVANGTNLKCGVYNASGALVGSQFSVADTLNSVAYPQVRLTNDGSNYWLAYFGSAANGVNVVQIPAAGASTGVSQNGFASATFSTSTFALDAAIINGLLVVFAASSSTSGQYWLTIGLPDASLGIVEPYLRTGATSFGTAAATTGSNWPSILSGGGGLYGGTSPPTNYPQNPSYCGDWTAILVYDQQNTAATYMGIVKVEASSIVGVVYGSGVAAGNNGASVSVNPGAGSYPATMLAGTPGTSFDHSANIPAGNKGSIFQQGVAFSNPAATTGVPNSQSGLVQSMVGSASYTYTASATVGVTVICGTAAGGGGSVSINGVICGPGTNLGAPTTIQFNLSAGQSAAIVTAANSSALVSIGAPH